MSTLFTMPRRGSLLCGRLLGRCALFAGLLGTAGAATLPDGYTAIEYIESTEAGQQYVNTGFFPTSNTVLTVDAQLTALPSVRDKTTAIFGTLKYPSGAVTFKCYASPHDTNKPTANVDRYRTQLGAQDGWNVTKAVANLTRTKYTMNAPKKYLTIQDMQDGLVYSKDFSGTNIPPTSVAKTSLDLMAYCSNSTHGSNPGPMRLYAATITEGGSPARDFVPCKNSAGVAGLYDTVGATFYPSSRSGQAFVAGPALMMTDSFNAATRSASVTFAASSDARALYLVGGIQDCAALGTAWSYEVKLADIPVGGTSLGDVPFPAAFYKAGCKRYRLQIRTADGGTIDATTPTRMCTARDETGRFNVYSDVTALYFGAEDKNLNGLFDAGDWTDVRHAANADSVTHTVSRYRGETTNLVVRSVDVFSPTMNKTLANQSCVFLQQGVSTWTEGDNTIRKVFPASMNLQKPIVGDTYTFLCRFRPGPHQTVKYNGGDTWLANFGCRWGATGAYFGFTGLAASGDPAEAYAMRYTNADGAYRTAYSLVVSNLFWHEVAFVVSGQYARVELANAAIGSGQQHDLFKIYENADSFPTNKCLTSAPSYYYTGGAYSQLLGNGSTKAATVTNSTYLAKDFRGDIHLAAIWNRALSHDEIVEAFSDAQPSQWRVGMTGCSADVLAGTATGDVTAGTDPSEWRKIPRTLVAGQKLTLNFKIEPTQANMQQVVRLVPACAANARVRFTLDGASLGEVTLTDASPALAFVAKGAMTAGDHALVVERMDDGSDALVVDTLEMCGSWQIGKANQSCEFGLYSVGNTDRVIMPMSPKNYPGTTYGSRVIKLRFYIPADVLSKARFRYVTNHPYEASKTDNTQVYTLNGAKIGEEHKLRQDVSFDFPEELLRAGENVLEIKMKDVSDGKTHWLQFDFHRLEMRLKRGLILILR